MRAKLIFLIFLAFNLSLFSQNDFKIGGEFRVRSELDGRDFLNKTYPQSFTASRLRLNIEKTIFDDVTIFVQLQDSRVFGQEKGTLVNIQNIDLHQGYVKVKNLFDLPIFLQVGRFKLNYGNFKLLGPNDWHNVGRSHDGLILGYEGKSFQIDGFLTVHNNFLNFRAGAADDLRNYDYTNPPSDTGFNIYGLYSTFKLDDKNRFDVYGLFEWDRRRPNGKDKNMERLTIGSDYTLSLSPFNFFLQAVYQMGSLFYSPLSKSLDISSFLIFGSVAYSFGDFKVSINADITSGGNIQKDNKYKLFDNPYSTKHNFQGYMDFFTKLSDLSFPTGTFGLQDYFFRANYVPKESKFSSELTVHYFLPFEKILYPVSVNPYNDASVYGTELDLVLYYNLFKSLKLEWGSGVFLPDKGMKYIYYGLLKRGTIDKYDPAFWTYLQLNLLF
ncbi:MAG: alginate export family protein [Candidatus Kapaibacteriales bacterium]